MSDNSKLVLKTIPESPGVYQFLNKDQKIIYVGKAKNLKKRVSSYFQKNLKSRKTINLVKNINSIEHVVVQSESDALLLENSLIKKNQPKYNILLRDDKTYPYIYFSLDHEFPGIYSKRTKQGSGRANHSLEERRLEESLGGTRDRGVQGSGVWERL